MLPSSASRRSRRTRGEPPEVDGAPSSQRVTPPRSSQEEEAEGQQVPVPLDVTGGPEVFATAQHSLGEALSIFHDARSDSSTDTIDQSWDTVDDLLAPVEEAAGRATLQAAPNLLTGQSDTMPLNDRENGADGHPPEEAEVAQRRLAAHEAKLTVWKERFLREAGQLAAEVTRVQADPTSAARREQLKEAYNRAKARKEAMDAERYRWETLIFESEHTPELTDTKMEEVDKTYRDVDQACRGSLLERAKELTRDPDAGLSNNDSKLFKLPAVEVPSFKGSIADFPSFERAFRAVIGASKLPDQYKLVHLKSALKGEATGLSNIVGTEAADYARLWDLLNARYGDVASLRAQVMADFMGLQGKDSAGPRGLRKLHDLVVTKYNRLKEVDPTAANRKEWVMLIIQPLYPRDLRRRICEKLGVEEPSIDEFLVTAEILISREMRMEHADQVNPLNGNHKTPAGGKNNDSRSKKKPGGNLGTTTGLAVGAGEACGCSSAPQAALAATSSKKQQPRGRGSSKATGAGGQKKPQTEAKKVQPCSCCGSLEGTLKCHKFLSMPNEKKREVLKKAKRCYKCLRSWDTGSDANRKPHKCSGIAICTKCKGGHWTQLHSLHAR